MVYFDQFQHLVEFLPIRFIMFSFQETLHASI